MALREGEERNFSNSLCEQKDLKRNKVHVIIVAVTVLLLYYSPGLTVRFIVTSTQNLPLLLWCPTLCHRYLPPHFPTSYLWSQPKKQTPAPGWCGPVDWVPVREPKGHWFDSQSGHMPELQARSPIESVQEAIFSCTSVFSPPLSPSLPLSLK